MDNTVMTDGGTDLPPEVVGKNKINEGTDWRGTIEIELGDETVEYTHRMLHESELIRVRNTIDQNAVDSDTDDIDEDARDRLVELQQKDELTDDERDEMRELGKDLAGDEDTLMDALSEDGMYLLMEMGRNAICPSEEYVDWTFSQKPATQCEHMGVESVPNPMTKEVVADELQSELRNDIDGQPYPIKIQIGMAAFAETMSVLGNGLQT